MVKYFGNSGNKYHAKKTHCAFCTKPHDSAKEAQRCNELHALLADGAITDLETQKAFPILPTVKYSDGTTERGLRYVADFVYYDRQFSEWVIEDVKSPITRKNAVYIIKRKLVKYRYCRPGDGEAYVFRET